MLYYYCGDFEFNVCTVFRTTKKVSFLLDDPRILYLNYCHRYKLFTGQDAKHISVILMISAEWSFCMVFPYNLNLALGTVVPHVYKYVFELSPRSNILIIKLLNVNMNETTSFTSKTNRQNTYLLRVFIYNSKPCIEQYNLTL